LKVDSAASSAEIRGDFSASAFGSFPSEANNVWYQYELSGAPISQLEIRLGDHTREVEVVGKSETSVESVFTIIISEIRGNETLYGGTTHRFAGALIILLIAPLLPFGAYLDLSTPIKVFFAAAGPIACLSLFLLPWASWFPGTFIYQGDPSWLVENAPILSLVGVVLTVITFAISITVSIYVAGPNHTSYKEDDSGETDT